MSTQSDWQHEHRFESGNRAAERGTWWVMWITAATMVLEIGAGWWFNAMALLADGWHMSSHAVAIGLSALSYSAARKYARDQRFAFGTWKIEVLGGFASAVFLLMVAALMVLASLERIWHPQVIHFKEATAIAVLGLVVNVICALILARAGGHGHAHGHAHAPGQEHATHPGHGHHHHGHTAAHEPPLAPATAHEDLNLKSAYLHVLTDAATSVLAIVALLGAWQWGWMWLDPAMGLVGGVLVALWAKGLIRQTGAVLLDREMDHRVVSDIRHVLQHASATPPLQVVDLHVWRVGQQAYACALTVVSSDPDWGVSKIRSVLLGVPDLAHLTVEVHQVSDA